MKRVLIVVGLLVLLAAPSGASGLGIMATYWDTSDAGDNEGVGFRLSLDATKRVAWQARLSLFEELMTKNSPVAGDLEAYPIDLGVAFSLRRHGTATPFVGGGVTYVSMTNKRGQMDDELGYYAVGGFEIPMGKNWELWAEGIWRSVNAQLEGNGVDEFVQERIDLDGVGLNVGFGIEW